MTAPSRLPRKDLLTMLLDAHERSISYGKPAPWPREVIVKFDSKTFPDAFAPSGRTIRAFLLAALSKLEEERCLRIVRHVKGPLTGESREIRLGPGQVAVRLWNCSGTRLRTTLGRR